MIRAVITTIRELKDEKEFLTFLDYLAAQALLLGKGGYKPPWNIEKIKNKEASIVQWLDDYKNWPTTTIVEVIEEGEEN